jgi:hypothetical protein
MQDPLKRPSRQHWVGDGSEAAKLLLIQSAGSWVPILRLEQSKAFKKSMMKHFIRHVVKISSSDE